MDCRARHPRTQTEDRANEGACEPCHFREEAGTLVTGEDLWVLQKLLGAVGRVSIALSGRCMRPMLPTSCTGEVVPVIGRPRTGDILVYELGGSGRLVCHRLIAIRWAGSGYLCIGKADQKCVADPAIPLERVVGRLTAIVAGGQRFSLDTPLVRALSYRMALCSRLVHLLWWRSGVARPERHRGLYLTLARLGRLLVWVLPLTDVHLVMHLWHRQARGDAPGG